MSLGEVRAQFWGLQTMIFWSGDDFSRFLIKTGSDFELQLEAVQRELWVPVLHQFEFRNKCASIPSKAPRTPRTPKRPERSEPQVLLQRAKHQRDGAAELHKGVFNNVFSLVKKFLIRVWSLGWGVLKSPAMQFDVSSLPLKIPLYCAGLPQWRIPSSVIAKVRVRLRTHVRSHAGKCKSVSIKWG